MSNEPFVRSVNPDKPDKAPDVTHGAPGLAHSSGAIRHELLRELLDLAKGLAKGGDYVLFTRVEEELARPHGVCVKCGLVEGDDLQARLDAADQQFHSAMAAIRGESETTQAYLVLDLLLDVAYHNGTPHELAVADEAYSLAGYYDPAAMISHATRDDVNARIAQARRGRVRRLLRHDAKGALWAIRALVHEGVLDGGEAARRTNQRWLERGGHDRQLDALPSGEKKPQ